MIPLKLITTGKALPANQVTSEALDLRLGFEPGHVQRRSGVAYRYHASPTDLQSDLAAQALHDALRRGAVAPESIDLLISACGVAEQALPNTAARILDAAHFPAGTPGMDINASCLGFLVALHTAACLIHAGAYHRVAIVASDLPSRGIDWADEESAYILGDGAAAAVVEGTNDRAHPGIAAYRLRTFASGKALCEIRAGGTRRNPRVGLVESDYLFHMDGGRAFKLASTHMPRFLAELFAQCEVAPTDIRAVVPHQASHLGMEHLRKRLGIDPRLLVDIYAHHGNQVAASIPTALHEGLLSGQVQRGVPILVLGTAAGLSLGGAILTL